MAKSILIFAFKNKESMKFSIFVSFAKSKFCHYFVILFLIKKKKRKRKE